MKFRCYNQEKIKKFVEGFSLFNFDDSVIQPSQHFGFDVVIEKLKNLREHYFPEKIEVVDRASMQVL